jgi:hypothetical protein
MCCVDNCPSFARSLRDLHELFESANWLNSVVNPGEVGNEEDNFCASDFSCHANTHES